MQPIRGVGLGKAGAFITPMVLLGTVLWPLATHAATPPNTTITNTARATYDTGSVAITVSGTVTDTTAAQTPARVEFLRYAPGTGIPTIVQPTISNGTTLPPPVFGATTLAVGGPLPLASATTFTNGEPVFVRVTDYDRNQDSLQFDTLSIIIRTLEGGEFENLVLTETGSDTGVFVGYVQSQQGEVPTGSTVKFIGFPPAPLSPAAINNGTLNTYSNAQLSATYQDGINGNTSIAAVALIDPFGKLFDAATGAPVNGAQITLFDVNTNQPAIVLGADGVSPYPATITTGGSVTDASGLVYNFAPGAYHFPFVAAGTYRFEVIPPTGFSFPSATPNSTLQTLPGAPYALVVGSRGENFPLADGPPLRIDIPLNSANGSLQITKSAGKATVAIGDYVPYTLSLRNPNLLPVNSVQIADHLPPGFRYQPGTARLNGAVLADPAIAADGRTLIFSIGTMTTGATANIKYVVSVVAGAQPGPAVNSAQSVGVSSNTARATVLVREDINHSRAILMGRVIVGSCDDTVENDGVGLPNARIVLQDGSYVLTDKEGRWHADNIRPGTHVVQLDLDSLPKDHEVVACEDNSRFAGRNYSQFVNVRGGSLWRADFYVKKLPPPVEIIEPIAPPVTIIEPIVPPVEIKVEPIVPPVEVKAEPVAQCAPVITPPPVPENSTFSADRIFAFNNATLNSKGIASLAEFVEKMRGVNFQSIKLIGHTDPLGSETYNMALSLRRAASVRDYFVLKGLNASIIEIEGAGESQLIKPLSECKGTRGKALSECLMPNRRVEVHVTILVSSAPLPQQTGCQVPDQHSQAGAAAQPEVIPVSSPPATNENNPIPAAVEAQPGVISTGSPPAINENKPLSDNVADDTNLAQNMVSTPVMPQVSAQIRHSLQLIEKLDYDEKWLVTATPGIEWLHPLESFQPALPAIKIAVKHLPGQRVEMKVNGERVNPLYFDGTTTNAAVNLGLSLWRGVTIKEGDNLVEMTVLDAKGDVVNHEKRNIHFGGGAVKAVIDVKQSVLVADGKTPPVIAVRFLDKDGKPVRRGISGEFQLNTPYLAQNTLNGIERQPLTGNLGNKNSFRVAEDGVALIALQPTTHTGEVVLGFDLRSALNRGTNFGLDTEVKKDRQEIRAWLAPGEREWILVGFAEGTVGHKKLSGNMENLKGAQADDKLFDQNRAAFYAKGTVRGEYLLTAAYDTAKEQGAGGARNLKQIINPDQYYTLYADATTAQFDAASISKLYLKIEKKQFYALFGDYDTGLTVTEMGRYSRTLNGIKSEFKGEKISYNAFASLTSQSYKKDEIQGDGTSGLYRLSSHNILLNSDKVRVEIRDRFQSQIIISSRTYSRFLDYTLDVAAGTLFFREPIPSRDPEFNPIFIVVEYEAEDKADEKMSYGGRAAFKANDQTEVGVTHISEGNIGKRANLNAVDAMYRLTEKTRLHAELANSERDINILSASGRAWLLEGRHEGEQVSARVYVREVESGFGLGQQGIAETGMRKAGSDLRFKISEYWQVQGAATHQENIATRAQRNTVEAQTQWHKDNLNLSGGLRSAQDKSQLGLAGKSNQALAGVAYSLLDKRLTLSANTEIDIGSQADRAASVNFPNRLSLGADYKFTQQTSLFAKQEFARGNVSADTTSIGLRTQPWAGSEAYTSLGKQSQQAVTPTETPTGTMDSWRTFASMGLVQKWQVN